MNWIKMIELNFVNCYMFMDDQQQQQQVDGYKIFITI